MTPTVSLFVVSHAPDYPWLEYLFRSIERNCSGFHNTIMAVPERDFKALPKFKGVRALTFDEEGLDPFMAHQLCKLMADECCIGDLICHVDSDCVFSAPTTPQTFIDPSGNAINLFSRFRKDTTMPSGWWPSPWKACTEKVLGQPVPFECMRRHGNIYWRDSYPRFRKHVEATTGKPLNEYLRGKTRQTPAENNFSEFVAMGAFCKFNELKYRWIEAEASECPKSTIHQFWSFHTVNHPSVKAKLKEFGLLT